MSIKCCVFFSANGKISLTLCSHGFLQKRNLHLLPYLQGVTNEMEFAVTICEVPALSTTLKKHQNTTKHIGTGVWWWWQVQCLDQLKQTVCSQTCADNTVGLRKLKHVLYITVHHMESRLFLSFCLSLWLLLCVSWRQLNRWSFNMAHNKCAYTLLKVCSTDHLGLTGPISNASLMHLGGIHISHLSTCDGITQDRWLYPGWTEHRGTFWTPFVACCCMGEKKTCCSCTVTS